MVGRKILKLLALLAGLVLGACAAAITAHPRPHPNPQTVLGYTTCETVAGAPVGYAFVRVWPLSEHERSEFASAIMHELKHAEQVARYKTCAAFERALSTDRAEIEAEAFCAVVQHAVKQGRTYREALRTYSEWLANNYPSLRLTPLQARQKIEKYCTS